MECCFWSRSALECAGVEGDTPVGVWRAGFRYNKSNWPWQWPVKTGESSIQG